MFSKLFVVRHRGFRRDFEVPVPNYIDRELRSYNFFVKEILLFGVIRVYSKTLFKEHVPNWAWIQEGTQGFTEWRSTAPQELWDLCKKV
jgi:hypothetical protein